MSERAESRRVLSLSEGLNPAVAGDRLAYSHRSRPSATSAVVTWLQKAHHHHHHHHNRDAREVMHR